MATVDEIKAEIFKVVFEAEAAGLDSLQAYKNAFPSAPDGPYWEAWACVESAKEKAWFDAMVRTIDGDTIRRASVTMAAPDTEAPPPQ
ncbi:hypothetical protein [Aureimonas sp. AU40]|uniref:hypothetical protein n=1 Tax=Aureimonas sp. AU40 TaxID=1637747 RepID=UPI0007836F6E|nr:hypothetical protein [Aureimonas sp. AU40]